MALPHGARCYIPAVALSAIGAALGVVGISAPTPAVATVAPTSTTAATTIGVGAGPFEVAVDSTTGRVYVTNAYSDTVSVIREATDTVIATIPVGANPRGLAVDEATDTVYVANFAADTVSVIDGATNTVTATIAGVGLDPSSVAVDAATDTIYVGGYLSSNVIVIAVATHSITDTISVPGGNVHHLVVDPATDTLFASVYSLNTVAEISTATNSVIASLTGLQGPDGLAVDPATSDLYAATNGDGADRVAAYATQPGTTNTETLRDVIHTKSVPNDLAVDPVTNTVFASLDSDSGSETGTVAIIKESTDKITQTVTVGDSPYGIDVDPTTGTVFVANKAANTLTAFPGSPRTHTPTAHQKENRSDAAPAMAPQGRANGIGDRQSPVSVPARSLSASPPPTTENGGLDRCTQPERGVAAIATRQAFVKRLVGNWLLCKAPSVFGTDEVGMQISSDGHWSKLSRNSAGQLVAIPGWGNQGSWSVVDDSDIDGPGTFQANFLTYGSGTVMTLPVLSSGPPKMRLNNEGVDIADYIPTSQHVLPAG